MSKTSDLHVQLQEEADPAQLWAEYRAQGGKLDFTAWQEKLEREENQ